MHSTPILHFDYQTAAGVSVGSEAVTGQVGSTEFLLNKHHITVPAGTSIIKCFIKGDAVYDALMVQRGTIWNPYTPNNADLHDGIGDDVDALNNQNWLIKLGEDVSSLQDRVDRYLLDRQGVLDSFESDAMLIKTQAFRLLVGKMSANYSSIDALAGTLVLKTQSDGKITIIGLGSNDYGSLAYISADQLLIDGSSTFFNSKTLAGNINSGSTTIDGGSLTADTIWARGILGGSVIICDSTDPKSTTLLMV